MYKIEILRSLVNERLTAAAVEIFGVFEKTLEEYEGEIDRQRELLDALMPEMRTDSAPLQLLVCEEEVHPEQQERSPSLLQGLEQTDIIELTLRPVSVKCERDGEKTQSSRLSQTQDPEPPQIKEEREELFQDLEEADTSKMTLHPEKYDDGENTQPSQLSQTHDPDYLQIKDALIQGLEEADSSKITVLPLKCGDGQENTLPFQPLQPQREKNREAYSLPSTSTEQMKTEPDGEDCGVSEPASNLDPAGDLEPARDYQLLSSDCSGTETEDCDGDWKSLSGQSKKTQKTQSLSNSRTLNRSMKSSHELKSSSHILSTPWCKVCGKSFPKKMSLMSHIRVHYRDCGLCGKHLDTTESLKLHLEAHRICTICGKGFTKNNDIVAHMRIHTGEKPFICSFCGKGFIHRGDLNRHMRTHTGEKPFSCSVCGKKFSQTGTVKRHMDTHLNEKFFSCSVCLKRFSQRGHLLNHMKIHTGEKPLSCTVCGKRFSNGGNLKAHMRCHTGESPYSCSVCGERFALLLYLTQHRCLTVSSSG